MQNYGTNILIIDTGSSSMRGTLLNERGDTLYSSSREYHMITDHTGACEMSPDIFHQALVAVCCNASAWSNANNRPISAIALTSQRSSVLPLDAHNEPLGNFIMWHDKRSSYICEQYTSQQRSYIYAQSGAILTPVNSAPKMCYIKEQMPDIYKNASKLIGIHDYLLLLLTGNLLTDISCAGKTGLLDIKRLIWSDDLLHLFGISRDKLCDLAAAGDIIGTVSQDFADITGLPRIPVITAGGDQQCSVLGQGLMSSGNMGVTIGTGSYTCMITDTPVIDHGQTINICPAITPGHWLIEASTMASGVAYRWLNENLYLTGNSPDTYDLINNALSKVAPGAEGVIALSCLSGKGCPQWNPNATGTIYNLTPATTKDQIARAVLEGIASEIAECFHALCSLSSLRPDYLSLCGGLTKYDTLNQMIADMIPITTRTYSIKETTIQGAWITASCTLGIYHSHADAIASLNCYKKTQEYKPDSSNHKIYQRTNKAREALYTSLPFNQIKNILKEEKNIEKK